jgi:hypothetical protein
VEIAPAVEVPPAPTPLLERITPTTVERPMLPPVEVPPPEIPLVPTPSLERVRPTVIERPMAPAVEIPKQAPVAPAPAIDRTPAREVAPVPAPRLESAPRTPADGAPERSDVFRKSPEAPPAAPGAAPRIDMDAARERAREIAREGTGRRAPLAFPMPPLEEKKSKEALALEKALKPDCRTAYKDMGLLAVAPLVMNAIGEGNCRW